MNTISLWNRQACNQSASQFSPKPSAAMPQHNGESERLEHIVFILWILPWLVAFLRLSHPPESYLKGSAVPIPFDKDRRI